MPDRIEFYHGKNGGLIASVASAMVPTIGGFISIKGSTYKIIRVTYALDYADDPRVKTMRCNVDLEQV